jgi:sterol desaturase/sphingolipid hydroxylase (fatty acid hydroxylase superfamily)
MSMLQRQLGALGKASAYPFLMSLVVWAAYVEYSPGAEHILAPAIFLPVFAIAIILERSFPYKAIWKRSWRESAQDIKFFFLIQPAVVVGELVAVSLGIYIATKLSVSLHESWGLSAWPFWIQFVLALLIADFPLYIFHRACHETSGTLWRLHSIHHRPDHVYSINFSRFHPLNVVINSTVTLLPLVALGVPAKVVFIVAMFQKAHGVLTHTNFDFRLGPLNRLLSMAELHRWHHVRELEIALGNYGSTLIIWDSLFGTKKYPSDREMPDVLGIHETKKEPIWKQMIGIFVPTGSTR